MDDLKERVGNKALSKLLSLGRQLKKLENELDNPPFRIGRELVQVQINSTLKEVEVWKFILNASNG